MESRKTGYHIAFEGIDGSGLTTHSKLLVRRLREVGFRTEYVKEPTQGPIGELIRTYLRKGEIPNHELLALLFAADRYWNYYLSEKSISKLKEEGFVVISDRYKYSSIAYQGAFTDLEWVWQVNSRVPHSDVIIFLDVPVTVALKRIETRVKNGSVREHYEKREFLEKIRYYYNIVLRKAEKEGVKIIKINEIIDDRELGIEEVNSKIYEQIIKLLH